MQQEKGRIAELKLALMGRMPVAHFRAGRKVDATSAGGSATNAVAPHRACCLIFAREIFLRFSPANLSGQVAGRFVLGRRCCDCILIMDLTR